MLDVIQLLLILYVQLWRECLKTKTPFHLVTTDSFVLLLLLVHLNDGSGVTSVLCSYRIRGQRADYLL